MVKKIAIGSLLILGLVLGGYSLVSAQTPPPADNPMYGRGGMLGRSPVGQPRGGMPGFAPQARPPLEQVAETLGMSEDDLRDAITSGQTLAQIAEAQGVSLDDLAAALLSEGQEHLQQAVSDGHLTQAQADERLAQIKADLLQRLESGERPGRPEGVGRSPMRGKSPAGRGFSSRGAAPMMARPPLEQVAETLGMSEDDLRDALTSGQTLAQIAEAQGVSLDDLAAAILTEVQEHLQQAVSDGHLTQAQADERLAQIKANLLQRLESGERPSRPEGVGRPPMMGKSPAGRGFGSRGAAPMMARPPLEQVAETLGMSEDDLRDALTSGQTLAQIAEARGVSLDDLAAALLTEVQEHLQQAVSDGRLTQAQADERLAQIKADLLQRLESGERPGRPAARPWGQRGHFR